MSETNNWILARLNESDRAQLLKTAKLRTMAFGQCVFTPGDAVEGVWFPEVGVISIITENEDGLQAESGLAGPENAAGILECLGSGVIASRGVVQSAGSAWVVPPAACRQLHATSADFRLATQLAGEFQAVEARQSLFCRSYHTIGARLARWLLEMLDRREDPSDVLEVTQEVLGAMLAVQRTTVSTIAARLQRQGVISVTRGKIAVIDKPGLEAMACSCRSALATDKARIHGAVLALRRAS